MIFYLPRCRVCKSILIAIHFSPFCWSAARRSVFIASRARVRLFSVMHLMLSTRVPRNAGTPGSAIQGRASWNCMFISVAEVDGSISAHHLFVDAYAALIWAIFVHCLARPLTLRRAPPSRIRLILVKHLHFRRWVHAQLGRHAYSRMAVTSSPNKRFTLGQTHAQQTKA